MRFGIRECANVVFRAKQEVEIGNQTFHVGQPVLYIDTATTSSMEQASTTTYAQGGRGNSRLIAWDKSKVLQPAHESWQQLLEKFRELRGPLAV